MSFIVQRIALLLLIIPCIPVFGTEEVSPCRENADIYARQYARNLREGNFEAMAGLLFQWEQDCGMNEPLFRARALQLMSEGVFPGALDPEQFLDYAIAFEIRYQLLDTPLALQDDYYAHHYEYFGNIPIGSEFDRITMQGAARLLEANPSDSLTALFLHLWSGNPDVLFAKLRDGALAGTPLALQYRERVKYFRRKPEYNLGLHTGVWIPGSDLSVLGNHPLLGLNLGVRKGNNSLDVVFSFRFGKTPSPVNIILQDTLATTRNHQGGFLGLEYSRTLFSHGQMRLAWHVGLGYDWVELVEEGHDRQRLSYGSFSLHTGPAYRHIFANRTWIMLKPSWFYLNHTGSSVLSLSGNAVGLNLVFGFSENPRKSQNLKRLGYQSW